MPILPGERDDYRQEYYVRKIIRKNQELKTTRYPKLFFRSNSGGTLQDLSLV